MESEALISSCASLTEDNKIDHTVLFFEAKLISTMVRSDGNGCQGPTEEARAKNE